MHTYDDDGRDEREALGPIPDALTLVCDRCGAPAPTRLDSLDHPVLAGPCKCGRGVFHWAEAR